MAISKSWYVVACAIGVILAKATFASWVGADGASDATLLTTEDSSFYEMDVSTSGDVAAILYQTTDNAIYLAVSQSDTLTTTELTADAGHRINAGAVVTSDDVSVGAWQLAYTTDGIYTAVSDDGSVVTSVLDGSDSYDSTQIYAAEMVYDQPSIIWFGTGSGNADIMLSSYDPTSNSWTTTTLTTEGDVDSVITFQTFGNTRGLFYLANDNAWHFYYRKASTDWADEAILNTNSDLGGSYLVPDLSADWMVQNKTTVALYFAAGKDSSEDPGNPEQTDLYALTAKKNNLSNWTLTKLSDANETESVFSTPVQNNSSSMLAVAWEGETDSGESVYVATYKSGSWTTSEVASTSTDNTGDRSEVLVADLVVNDKDRPIVLYRIGSNVEIDNDTNEDRLKNVETYIGKYQAGSWDTSVVYEEEYEHADPLALYSNGNSVYAVFTDHTAQIFTRYKKHFSAANWVTKYYTHDATDSTLFNYSDSQDSMRELFHDYGVVIWNNNHTLYARTVDRSGSRSSGTWCNSGKASTIGMTRVGSSVSIMAQCEESVGVTGAETEDSLGVMTLVRKGKDWDAKSAFDDYGSFAGDEADNLNVVTDADATGRYYTLVRYEQDGSYALVFNMQR